MIDFDRFSPAEDTIRDRWVAALQSVETPDQLRELVNEWAPLWTTPFPGKTELSSLGDYDAGEALRCIAANRKALCEHGEKGEDCVAQRILIPEIMLRAELILEEYKVPFNCALQQLVRAAKP